MHHKSMAEKKKEDQSALQSNSDYAESAFL
jgi:hypothetical protein